MLNSIQETSGGTAPRMPALDGLRGLAILMVLLHTFNPLQGGGFPGREIKIALDLGWVGVQLFFVLSGFLITGILLDSRGSPGYLRIFLARRALRIFPLYYGVLLVAFVVLPAVWPVAAQWRYEYGHQGWLWTYLANWVQADWPNTRPFAHFWSLCVEEQFYLVWPLLLYRMKPARVLQVSVMLMMISPVVRALMVWEGANPEAIYMSTICRMDALAAGAMGAALLRIPGARHSLTAFIDGALWVSAAALAAGALFTHVYERLLPLTQVMGYSLFAMVFGILVLKCAMTTAPDRVWLHPLRSRLLGSVGRYSYAMYIFGPIMEKTIGSRILQGGFRGPDAAWMPGLAYCLCMTLLAYVCGWISFHALERHFLGLKARFARPARLDALLRTG